MKLLGKSEAEYDAMTPEEKEKAFDKLKANAGTKKQGNIAADTSRKSFAEQFFGGVTDSFRNSISIAMGSTDFSSTTVEFKDGKVHVRTCFTAGTKIHTKDGIKVIEDIQIGDVVLSWNEKTGKREYKRVTNIWQRTTNELYEVKLPGQEPIITTWNHPFWSLKQSAWVEAKDLKQGEILSLEDGSEVAIESIIHYDTEDTTVYNFEVEDNHTYYVSEAGVLVHNQSTLCLPPVTGAGMSLDPNTGIGSLVSGASDFIRENPTLDGLLDRLGLATPIHAFGDAHKDLVKFETLSALKNLAIGMASLPVRGKVGKGSGVGKPYVLNAQQQKIPGKPFKGKNAPKDAFKHLKKYHGLDENKASERLHVIKQKYKLKPIDNVIIGKNGDVFSEKTGMLLDNLLKKDI